MGFGFSLFTIVDVTPYYYETFEPFWIRVKGSGFDPGDEITLAICENNCILDLWETEYLDGPFEYLLEDIEEDAIEANDCGAFEVYTYIPDIWSELWYDTAVVHVSLKAWEDAETGEGEGCDWLRVTDGNLQATYPLDVWNVYDFHWGWYYGMWMLWESPIYNSIV